MRKDKANQQSPIQGSRQAADAAVRSQSAAAGKGVSGGKLTTQVNSRDIESVDADSTDDASYLGGSSSKSGAGSDYSKSKLNSTTTKKSK